MFNSRVTAHNNNRSLIYWQRQRQAEREAAERALEDARNDRSNSRYDVEMGPEEDETEEE